MKKLLFLSLLFAGLSTVKAQDKLAQDREAIKSLAGFYEVTFDYSETFAPKSDYKFFPRQSSHGSEWVVIVEESPKKIVLQHILVIGKEGAMKHWREDWTYEDPTLLVYDKDNTWTKVHTDPAKIKGSWAQKVYQVDDSPRYESRGTWVHVDGAHRWESITDSPLPRREHTIRNDYNVLNRTNRLYFTKEGWMFEQDNKKISREAGKDVLIASEKGLEEFVKSDPEYFANAQKWWGEQLGFWNIVRGVWDEQFAKNNTIKFQAEIDGKPLYSYLFPMADKSVKEKWSTDKSKMEATAAILKFIGMGVSK